MALIYFFFNLLVISITFFAGKVTVLVGQAILLFIYSMFNASNLVVMLVRWSLAHKKQCKPFFFYLFLFFGRA